jgi:hypothetical protein
MKKIRPPRPDDQDNAQKAYQLIMDLMEMNKGIEPALWCGAVWSVLVNGYKQCDFSYEDFRQEVNKISQHYKSWWEDEVGQ